MSAPDPARAARQAALNDAARLLEARAQDLRRQGEALTGRTQSVVWRRVRSREEAENLETLAAEIRRLDEAG
ncbi:MAG TPA: hypothetical protein VHN99_08165 [Deinococcales bacterium]|nr:hypothetical protein [Deinococcales bacterium]